uniref:DDE-1 domain-containing protein n=1 Tax=Steinernema glaseri TaxID=37863 RepID=A0A1I8AIP1_9BILA
MESVCLCLVHRPSVRESTELSSRWGKICTATREKIHHLSIFLDWSAEKIYAAAQYDAYSNYVPLDSVNLKFITNFRIDEMRDVLSNWKEITLDDLKKLVRFIRPISQWAKLLSMRLSVDSVTLGMDEELEEADEFFETAGPLYDITYIGPTLKPNTTNSEAPHSKVRSHRRRRLSCVPKVFQEATNKTVRKMRN